MSEKGPKRLADVALTREQIAAEEHKARELAEVLDLAGTFDDAILRDPTVANRRRESTIHTQFKPSMAEGSQEDPDV